MVGRIEIGTDGPRHRRRLSPRGRWRRQRARNVVVAGYAIETPRLLLNSACATSGRPRQRAGLVGTHLMVPFQPRRLGRDGGRDPLVQGRRPRMAVTRALELRGQGQGLPRRLRLHEPGAAAVDHGRRRCRQRGMWGMELRQRMAPLQSHGRPEDRRRDRAARGATASSWPTRRTSSAFRSRASPSPTRTTTGG